MIDNISVVCCFYNTNPKYLHECFFSIYNAICFFNSYYNVPIKIYVCDDGTDKKETLDMFYEYIFPRYKDLIVLVKHKTNITLSSAINDVLKIIPKNSLVIYIDSDDMMMYNRILIQYEIFTKYDHWSDITLNATLTCTPNIIINSPKYLYKYNKFKQLTCIDDNSKNIIVHPSIAYKINDIRKYNIWYDKNLKCTQDFDFILHILDNHLKIQLTPDALTWWRQYPDDQKPDFNRYYEYELKIIKNKYNRNDLQL